jgi:Leucine-rich repeat (LRR) protein
VPLTKSTSLSTLTGHAASLSRLSLHYVEPGAALTTLPALPNLQSFDADLRGITDLRFTTLLPQINQLWLTNCQDIRDYSPLRHFIRLQILVLSSCEQLFSLRQLPQLSAMRVLSLNGSAIREGTLGHLIGGAPGLTDLYLAHCGWIGDLTPLEGHRLRTLDISDNNKVANLGPLQWQTRLSDLNVSKTRVRDLTPLQGLHHLQVLRLTWCKNVCDLRPLATLPNLAELHIEQIAPGVDLSPLAASQHLTIYIAPGQNVRGAESLRHQPEIR